MENKENMLNSELKEEELDKVSGGVTVVFQPVDLIYDPQPDPFLDDPDSHAKPGQPKDPKIF